MQKTVSAPKRIVIKFGTGILTKVRSDGIDIAQLRRLSADVAGLVKSGHECLVVTSGAVGAGMLTLGFSERPKELALTQACAAVGQCKLMRIYETHFARHGLAVAQLLLTHQDIDSRLRHQNARNTLEKLLAHHTVVPIINENDSVAVEELRFGDNDRLSAEVAMLADADLLIILSTVNGLTETGDGQGQPIALVDDVDRVMKLATAQTGRLSVGGMSSKLQAVKLATSRGIASVIGNGRTPGLIGAIVAGKGVATRFLPAKVKAK